MINFLFNLLLLSVLLIALLIVIVGGLWILSYELTEALQVDVLFKIKRKVRIFIYGTETEEECVQDRDSIREKTEKH